MKYMSVYSSDCEILKAFSNIYLGGKWFDADVTYSKGVFYENTDKPKIKGDLIPQQDDVIQGDSQTLDYIQSESCQSIVFDPPFLFRNRKAVNNDKMCARFSYFKCYEELQTMYQNSMKAIWTKLCPKGYLFFKCQDMTDGKFYCTHMDIINHALKLGYILKDIGIKVSKSKLQRDAVQQNCLAKTHSYWLVLQKPRNISV